MYLGENSIKMLAGFLTGYETGAHSTKNELGRASQFFGFDDWIAEELGHSSSVPGWCNMILWKAKSDEKAFDLFFELLDKFKAEGCPKSERIKSLLREVKRRERSSKLSKSSRGPHEPPSH
jgi:hypothetical protein